ncbi:MAG: glycosyltransferase, partial [Actinobacteria bacterium]|nr:glycosyltransferase [Actinomycetota bacterium]
MTSELDPVTSIEPNRDNIVRRPIVVIPVYNASNESIACLESVLRHTPADVRVLIIDDHGQDREFFEHLDKKRSSLRHRVDVHRPESNGGFLGSCN